MRCSNKPRSNIEPDPFSIFVAPPPGETSEERTVREDREAAARIVNDQIDEELKVEKERLRKKQIARVLVLGQRGSGKTTFLNKFRYQYAREAWEAEQLGWRYAIQLDLVRSVLGILDAVHAQIDVASLDTPRQIQQLSGQQLETLLDMYADIREQLEPLRTVKLELMSRLGASGTEDYESDDSSRAAPRIAGQRRQGDAPPSSEGQSFADEGDINPTQVLANAREAMLRLWKNDVVHTVLKLRVLKIDDIFLDDIQRIASLDYTPSDEDIVRARRRTLPVQEYRVLYGVTANYTGQEWQLYEVGGPRTMRHAWMPYFDDVDVIVFLVPVSCFNERDTDNVKVTALEDSFLRFKDLCSSDLLKNAAIICIFNKCDLLTCKLSAGVKVRDYIPSFGERKNEMAVFLEYLRDKFLNIRKKYSREHRRCHFYTTSFTDTRETVNIITEVKRVILQNSLVTVHCRF